MKIDDELIVKIIKQDNFGQGISKQNGFVVFVKNAIVGEKLKVKITSIKKNYAEAEIIEILEKSDNRRKYSCIYYNKCGGCSIGHQVYKYQTKFKESVLKEILKINDIEVVTTNEENYRNKVVLRISNGNLGFYENKTNNIIDIGECVIADNKINNIIKLLKGFKYINDIEEITIRSLDQLMINFVTIKDISKEIINTFKGIDSIYINNEYIYGNQFISIRMFDLNFFVSNNSFFQVNIDGTVKLYNKIIEYANLNKKDRVLDLYCGVGTISLILSKYCYEITGIEIVEEAIKNANFNKSNNNIINANFICGDVKNIVKEDMSVDVLILDPPRKGLDIDTIENINIISPNKIVYVSCNPSTLKRDLLLFKDYILVKTALIDMFPNTYHIETVNLLVRRKEN